MRIIHETRTAIAIEKPRRGAEGQSRRRQLERLIRRSAVATARWMGLLGLRNVGVAERLGMNARTLGTWVAGWRSDRLALQEIGRKAMRVDRVEREAILGALGLMGPGTSVATLEEMFPEVARRELEDLVNRYRDDFRSSHSRMVMALKWTRAGRVWAMDYTDPPLPVDGKYPFILVVRDLASGEVLLAQPCEEATARVTKDALTWLLKEHGAPLVVKHDNGSHFDAEEVRELLGAWGIIPLVSPPRTPQYNGAAEAGIGSVKSRAHLESARNDRPGEWTCDDVEKARAQANLEGRPRGFEGPSPEMVWENRRELLPREREEFRQRVRDLEAEVRREKGIFPLMEISWSEQKSLDRIAIARTCVALGYLTFRRRRIPLRLSDLKRERIS